MPAQTQNANRVTVLVDTYNHERFIEEALVSVLEQDFPADDTEILVVDDGSTDRTPEIVRKVAPRVRLIRKTNGGQASAFNVGIPEASGDIIAFLDGDDWWKKNKLSAVVRAFHDNPAVGMVGHAIIESHAGREHIVSSEISTPLQLDSVRSAEIFRLYRPYFGTSRLALRSIVARQTLPVPEVLVFEADEYLFTIAAALTKWVVLKEPLTHYRIHSGNLFLAAGSSAEGLRRKQRVLSALESALRRDLAGRGVPSGALDCVLELVGAEALQLRLMCEGGSPSETIWAESVLFGIQRAGASAAQKLFHKASLLPAWLLPPRMFYRARFWLNTRSWYADFRKTVLPVPEFTDILETNQGGESDRISMKRDDA
ncbi:MAG: glycosyltransferase [Candidatus Acidiferrales bacterium]